MTSAELGLVECSPKSQEFDPCSMLCLHNSHAKRNTQETT